MILLAAITGVSAAVLLLAAGYLFGVKQGFKAREQLHLLNFQQADGLQKLRERLTQQQQSDADIQSLRTELNKVQQALTPLIQRERLGFALANLQTGAGRHRDLMSLIDQIAANGNFSAVLLNDAEGLPLAASSNTKDFDDRLAMISSMVLLLADRISRDNAPNPLAVMVHDESNKLTLCRIFRVGGKRLLLTAVSTDAQLLPTALDPALAKLDTVLSA
jgi:predicted regulator of Ras-like GTPase activity (Roadblock/LC7/MglB family)